MPNDVLGSIYTPNPGAVKGGAALGQLLSGDIGTLGVYEEALKKAHDAGKARAQRLLVDAQLTSRQGGLKAALIAGGVDPAQAAIAEQIGQMNQTFNASQAGSYMRPGYLEVTLGARDAILGTSSALPPLGQAVCEDALYAQSLGLPPPAAVPVVPDVPRYNMLNAMAAGKSYQPTQVLGGAYVADGVALDDLDMVPTLGTLTKIKGAEAKIEQAQQRTNAAVAKSNRAPKSSGGGKITTASREAAELANARAAVQAGADPIQVAELLRQRGFPSLAKKVYAGD